MSHALSFFCCFLYELINIGFGVHNVYTCINGFDPVSLLRLLEADDFVVVSCDALPQQLPVRKDGYLTGLIGKRPHAMHVWHSAKKPIFRRLLQDSLEKSKATRLPQGMLSEVPRGVLGWFCFSCEKTVTWERNRCQNKSVFFFGCQKKENT